MKLPNVSPVIRDLTVTAFASGVTFFCGLALVWLIGRLLGVTLLAEYLLLRRVANWLQPVMLLGIGVALARHVAYSTGKQRTQVGYFVAAASIILVFGIGFGALVWTLRLPLTAALFGDARLSGLMLPMLLLIVCTTFGTSVYGYYRGRLKMHRAAVLQIAAATIPLLTFGFLFRTRSLPLLVSVTGLAIGVLSVFFAIPILAHARNLGTLHVASKGVELLKYGVPRVPGDLSMGTMFAVGSVVAAHYVPVPQLASLLVATSILVSTSASTEPLGVILLSKVSMLLAENKHADVQRNLAMIMSASIDLSLFLTIQLLVFADVLVRAWVGQSVLSGISVVRILILGIPFYVFFTALRAAIDAGTVVPMNALNLLVSLVSLLVLLFVSIAFIPRDLLLQAIAASMVCSFVVLAFATRRSLRRLYGVRAEWKESLFPAGCAVALGIVGVMVHRAAMNSLVVFAAIELLFASVFLYVCYRRSPWVQIVWSRMWPESANTTAQLPVKG